MMSKKIVLSTGTLAIIGLGGFIALRLFVRRQFQTGMWNKYNSDRLQYGVAFLLAAYGTVPPTAPTDQEIKSAIAILVEQRIPIWSFDIPTEDEMEVYVQDRAIPASLRQMDTLLNTPWLVEAGIKRGAELLSKAL
jgi:hypothetical protein